MTSDEKILYRNMARTMGGTTTTDRMHKTIKVFGEELASMLYMYGEVRIEGFGTFKLTDSPNTGGVYSFRNFQTGEMEERFIESKKLVRFKNADKFRTLSSGKPVGEYKKGRLKGGEKPKTVRKKKTQEEIDYERRKFLEEKRG